MNILEYQSFYLVGIKGVAMTSLAQCLVDAGKTVRGSDVAEEFVTQTILNKLPIRIDVGFETEIPAGTECVIYTAAHQAQKNPQVQKALMQKLPVLSHAEALGHLFNQKKGIAVCGVGGKSTTSAMVTWILEKTGRNPSYAVGVGNIPGLERTGKWSTESEFFVAEADEYVTDPSAPSRGEEITPRFSFLQPFVTVCTNMTFDHPDVYRDFDHTKEVYAKFFNQIKEGGYLITNADNHSDRPSITAGKNIHTLDFGTLSTADFIFDTHKVSSEPGKTSVVFRHQAQEYTLTLQLPGAFNLANGLAAISACYAIGVPIEESIHALKDFRSTQRRAEFIGEKHGVLYYDDYAHHPNEVKNIIYAFKAWFPAQRLVVAFQSHTFSRTKSLFPEFVEAFEDADEVVMIDIFPSAREAFDPTVTSDALCQEIHKRFPQITATNVKTIERLAEYCQTQLKPGDVLLTVGAGDIYEVHKLVK